MYGVRNETCVCMHAYFCLSGRCEIFISSVIHWLICFLVVLLTFPPVHPVPRRLSPPALPHFITITPTFTFYAFWIPDGSDPYLTVVFTKPYEKLLG